MEVDCTIYDQIRIHVGSDVLILQARDIVNHFLRTQGVPPLCELPLAGKVVGDGKVEWSSPAAE